MKKTITFTATILTLAGVAYAGWWHRSNRQHAVAEITFHGNVDLRQVDLPFNAQHRVAEVLVEEGSRVTAGELLARLDDRRAIASMEEARARVEAQQRIIERLVSGTRAEEIEQIRANITAAEVSLANAKRNHQRVTGVAKGVASVRELDDVIAAVDSAAATLEVQRRALDLALAGTRAEDLAEARATLAALESQLVLRERDLADMELRSPVTGIVRNRILEVGEMSSPGMAAVTIAVTDPKWVRAYVNEPDLGKVKTGGAAVVTVDAYPGREFAGWVGFISPVAEFTPKNVETAELRTALMYEVRIFFRDPQDELRLGMPATVRLGSGEPQTRNAR